MSNIESIVKGAWKSTKNTVLQVPEIEKKVKEATSNDPWGPTGTQMREIAQASHHYHDLPLVMATIWRRLNDHGKYWRHVYKSLLVIDYLLRNGSDQVIRECRDNIIQIQTLTEFQHIENDKDVGLSVRERAKLIVELIHDEKRLKVEREKARATSKKFLVGMSNDVSGGYGGGGYGGSGYGGGYDNSDYDSDARRSEYNNDDRSYETEEPEQPSPSTRTSSSESPSSNSDSRRPRAPSFGSSSGTTTTSRSSTVSSPARSTAPAPAPAPASAPAPNLFDLDVPSTPAKNQDFDFFNTPVATNPAPFGTNPSPYGTNAAPFATNPTLFTGSSSSGQTNLFDPRTNATQAPTTQSSGNSGWANFQSYENDASTSAPAEEKKNDPWNQTHLINLDFAKSSSSTTPQIKPSMGTLATAPMGGTAKPMGQPTNAMGPGKPATTTPSAFPAPTGQMGTMGMNPVAYPTGMQPGYPTSFGPTYTATTPMGVAPVYTQPGAQPVYSQPLGGYGVAPNTMYTAQKPTGTQPNWF